MRLSFFSMIFSFSSQRDSRSRHSVLSVSISSGHVEAVFIGMTAIIKYYPLNGSIIEFLMRWFSPDIKAVQ